MNPRRLLLCSTLLAAMTQAASAIFILDTYNPVTISPVGTLDMQNNAAIFRADPFAEINGYVATGYNGGLWNGFQINSSTAANDPNHISALGCIPNELAGYSSFLGITTPLGDEVFVMFTYYGDANLDGLVDSTDYGLMNPLGTNWYQGDFNYDGVVNTADYALIDHTVAVLAAPEPTGCALLVAGGLLLTSRRRRQAR